MGHLMSFIYCKGTNEHTHFFWNRPVQQRVWYQAYDIYPNSSWENDIKLHASCTGTVSQNSQQKFRLVSDYLVLFLEAVANFRKRSQNQQNLSWLVNTTTCAIKSRTKAPIQAGFPQKIDGELMSRFGGQSPVFSHFVKCPSKLTRAQNLHSQPKSQNHVSIPS